MPISCVSLRVHHLYYVEKNSYFRDVAVMLMRRRKIKEKFRFRTRYLSL